MRAERYMDAFRDAIFSLRVCLVEAQCPLARVGRLPQCGLLVAFYGRPGGE